MNPHPHSHPADNPVGSAPGAGDEAPDREALLSAFRATRRRTLALTEPLSVEDQCLQSMPDASPAKWHLGHTTWFFETFILSRHLVGHEPFDTAFGVLFNSYYNGIGEQFPRPSRGLLSRPALDTVLDYRRRVEDGVERLLTGGPDRTLGVIAPLVLLGIHHEQQHQELLITDIKHALFQNPTAPAYRDQDRDPEPPPAAGWRAVAAGKQRIGHEGAGFCFDNETPAHDVLLGAFELRDAPVSNAEWLAFMRDGGYQEPLLWLSDGWAWREANGVRAPLYWTGQGEEFKQFTLNGQRPVDPHAPVCHISYYEADAFARWADARLPTEFEWEAARPLAGSGRSGAFDARREFASTWEWTGSAYLPYPGFRPARGAVGEYNGKFMINQMVLRGASNATAPGHARHSYRNFFHPSARWQYSGLRLARDPDRA